MKGTKFSSYQDAGHPVTTAKAHNAQGADEVMILDIEASRAGRQPQFDVVEAVAKEVFVPLLAGGGINSVDIARRYFEVGCDKVFVNTGALDNPEIIGDMAAIFGSQAIVLGVDVVEKDGKYKVYDFRTTEADGRDLFSWIRMGVERGAGEIRLMFVDREGLRGGVDIDLLKKVRDVVRVPIVVEGGVGSFEDIGRAFTSGADGVALGTFLIFSDNNIIKVKRAVRQGGHHVRID